MTSNPLDSFSALNVFVQAAEVRSFTVAGQRLGISSSAVGKAINRLELRLGVRLFHRSTRAIRLTLEGSLFLERCRKIICEMEAAELELSQSHARPAGPLRVSLPLVGMLLMPTLSAFMREWPEIVLHLDFSDRIVDVIEEGFDVVIRTGEAGDSRLMTRALGKFQYRLVGAPSYFERTGYPVRPADLKLHRCLHHRYPSTGKLEEWSISNQNGEPVRDIPITSVSSAVEPLLTMVENGLGIACLPDFVVCNAIIEKRLISIFDGAIQNAGTFRILWPSSRYMSPKLRVFVDFMADHLFSKVDQCDAKAVLAR